MSPQCELNNATVEEQDNKLKTNDSYIYQGTEVSEELQSGLQLKYGVIFAQGVCVCVCGGGGGGVYFLIRG